VADPHGSHLRLQYALHRLLGGGTPKLKPMNESPTAMPWDSIRLEIKDKL
jgi:hypothetical protein